MPKPSTERYEGILQLFGFNAMIFARIFRNQIYVEDVRFILGPTWFHTNDTFQIHSKQTKIKMSKSTVAAHRALHRPLPVEARV